MSVERQSVIIGKLIGKYNLNTWFEKYHLQLIPEKQFAVSSIICKDIVIATVTEVNHLANNKGYY